jgi:hypothetical protein
VYGCGAVSLSETLRQYSFETGTLGQYLGELLTSLTLRFKVAVQIFDGAFMSATPIQTLSANRMQVFSEKRSIRRFPLELPILLNVWEGTGRAVRGQTRDISSQGVCFLLDVDAEIGSSIDFVLTLPAEVTMTEPIRVRCRASVLRTASDGVRGKKLVAAKIHRYEFIAPEMA